jgi:hypothetical protein
MEQQMDDSKERWVDDSDGRETIPTTCAWDTELEEENGLDMKNADGDDKNNQAKRPRARVPKSEWFANKRRA